MSTETDVELIISLANSFKSTTLPKLTQAHRKLLLSYLLITSTVELAGEGVHLDDIYSILMGSLSLVEDKGAMTFGIDAEGLMAPFIEDTNFPEDTNEHFNGSTH